MQRRDAKPLCEFSKTRGNAKQSVRRVASRTRERDAIGQKHLKFITFNARDMRLS
ncbi:hypothetical protein bcgnr5380_59190 [Bacillus cereus]|jgi:hypothetical protein